MAFKLFDNVMESSTTTGTGDFTLAGAITGFSTFASRYSTGDTCYYAIKEVDAAGGPSGAWEVGIGTYSAANTLTRTTVLSSSNSDAAVNFAAGTKRAFVTLTALQGGSIRERLTAARTYYVRTDGSDSNNGLANTSGGAFLTIQKAVDVIAESIDIASGVTVTIQVADGTYTGAVSKSLPFTGAGTVLINGNSGTPSNVVLASITARDNASISVTNVKMDSSTSFCLYATSGGIITFGSVVFGTANASHMRAAFGGVLTASASYSVSTSVASHIQSVFNGAVGISNVTVTFTGTPQFTTGFADAQTGGVSELYNNTYSGSTGASSKKYVAATNAVVQTYGGTLPGAVGGTTATGGQYA